MDSDRRFSTRRPTIIAVEIDGTERKGRLGVSRDTSQTGMLMATPSRFEIGEELSLKLFVNHTCEEVRGRVIRVETTPMKGNEIWRYRLAVEFTEPLSIPVNALPS
jgi:hypothetical protein